MERILYIVHLWLFLVPVFPVLTILAAMTVIIGCLLGGKKIFVYYPGMIWPRLTCYLALCSVTVKGYERINRRQSYVFVTNHQGAFGIFLIYGFLGAPTKWVIEAGIAKIPFVGAVCCVAGFISVDNSIPRAVARSILEAKRYLRNGASVVVFPGGLRTYDGKMARLKKGAYQMALDQHLSITPITLNGPFDVLPIRSLNVHRHRMKMVIHSAISIENIDTSHKGIQAFIDQTQEIIVSALWEGCK